MYLSLFTAEDPAEVTLQSRALTTLAISTYAAKKEKERERKKREQISSAEDESENRELMHDEDDQGFEEEKQESSGPDEHVRNRLYQHQRNEVLVLTEPQVNAGIQSKMTKICLFLFYKQMVRTAEEEGVSDAKTALDQTAENSEEEDHTVA